MASTIIKWSKKYQEDLGELDQDSFYDHVHRWSTYLFQLPAGCSIEIRNDKEFILEGNLFIFKGNELDKDCAVDAPFVSAVIAFMYTKQEIVHFNLFDGDYKPIDLSELIDNSSDFCFIEVEPEG
jgi:hypothetical protein